MLKVHFTSFNCLHDSNVYEPPSPLHLMRARGRVPTDPKIGNKSTQKIHPKRNSPRLLNRKKRTAPLPKRNSRLLESIAVSAALLKNRSQPFVRAGRHCFPVLQGVIPPGCLRCVALLPASLRRGAPAPARTRASHFAGARHSLRVGAASTVRCGAERRSPRRGRGRSCCTR